MNRSDSGPSCHDDGDALLLHCERCAGSTQVEVPDPPRSKIFECRACGGPLYWHHCSDCGLSYVGQQVPRCAVCDGEDEEISFQ